MSEMFLLGASLYIGDMLFYAICFLILMALIAKFAWDPVNEMLKKRADHINSNIDAAENEYKTASDLANQRQNELNNSKAESAKIIDDAKILGNKQRDQILSGAQRDAQFMKDGAQQQIDQERRDALKGVKQDVASIAVEVASKIMKKELSAENHKKLIDSYIDNLGDDAK